MVCPAAFRLYFQHRFSSSPPPSKYIFASSTFQKTKNRHPQARHPWRCWKQSPVRASGPLVRSVSQDPQPGHRTDSLPMRHPLPDFQYQPRCFRCGLVSIVAVRMYQHEPRFRIGPDMIQQALFGLLACCLLLSGSKLHLHESQLLFQVNNLNPCVRAPVVLPKPVTSGAKFLPVVPLPKGLSAILAPCRHASPPSGSSRQVSRSAMSARHRWQACGHPRHSLRSSMVL